MAQYEEKAEWPDAMDRVCKQVHAKGLNIDSATDPSCWTYGLDALKSGECFEVAELLQVCRLDVQGKLGVTELSPNTEYEVFFVVKLKSNSYGFERPVSFNLATYFGQRPQNKLTTKVLNNFKGLGWMEIPIGRFNTGKWTNGEIEFKMYEHGGQPKKGLVVRGVIIRPRT